MCSGEDIYCNGHLDNRGSGSRLFSAVAVFIMVSVVFASVVSQAAQPADIFMYDMNGNAISLLNYYT